MFFYQNVIERPKISISSNDIHPNKSNFITIILNEIIYIRCPLENAIYLSGKIKIIVQNNKKASFPVNEKGKEQKLIKEDEKEKDKKQMKIDSSAINQQQYNRCQIKESSTGNAIYIYIDDKKSNQRQSITEEIQEKKDFYQKQLSLLFNGYDISISNEYLPQFKTVCKSLQITSFFKQLEDYYELPEIHETLHEITVLRNFENYFFSLTEDNIETSIHQIWSLFYQTRPEFFCLILLNQCLIQSKSIELFVYLFEEILHKIDELNELISNESQERQNQEKQSLSLQKLLECIIQKSLRFEGTYGPYKPESDIAHEMFPQEYFYLCQVLYSRGLITRSLFKQSFENANWATISCKNRKNSINEKVYGNDNHTDKIFITEDQYITIEDFSTDFTDKKCRYKHLNEEEVEKLITQNKNKFIHKTSKIKNDENYVNWVSLFLEGENPDSIAALLRKDDIEKFQWLVNSKFHSLEEFIEKHGKIRRSIYERKSVVNKNLTLIEYAAFYGSVKCFKYLLMNECKLDMAAKYAVAGSNSEIIHICQQHKATFDGSLLLSIRYHRWEITEWLLETLNVQFNAIMVVKLCINCGNFLSLHFIIEKILSQKAGKQVFVDEVVTVQAMFRLKCVYGFLMIKHNDGINIGFNDNNAIFWHEPFFSYLFDYIKPREIRDECQKQREKKDKKTTEQKESEETEKSENEEANNKIEKTNKNSQEIETESNQNKFEDETENNKETEKDQIKTEKDQIKTEKDQIKTEKDQIKTETENNKETEKDQIKIETGNYIENESNQNLQNKVDANKVVDDRIDSFEYDYDYEDEINEALHHLRSLLFYEIPPEMIELIIILQNCYFQINIIPYRSISPLHVAIERNDMKFITLLRNHSELDINKSTFEYPPPLLYSIKLCNENIFEMLCRDPTVNPNGSSSTVSFIASEYDANENDKEKNEVLLRMLNRLLQNKKFNPNAGTSFTQQGIFNAFEKREYRLLDVLIKSPRVSLNCRNKKGQTLLHLAILNDDKKLFDMLLDAKERVDLNLQTRILAKDSDIYKQPRLDKSPILLCLEKGRLEMFERLIENDGVDIRICDDKHETVMMFIVKNDKVNALFRLKKLFELKRKEFIESIKIKNDRGLNLMQIAENVNNKEVVEFLKECEKRMCG